MDSATKQDIVVEALALNEAGLREPHLVNQYIDRKARTEDPADRMLLDLSYWELLGRLRREGKISTVEELIEQAKEMIDLPESDLLRVFSEKANEFRRKHSI